MKRFGVLIAFAILCIAVASAFAGGAVGGDPPAPLRSIPFDATAKGEPVPAGAFGYGMMQTREMLTDFCPREADYAACRDILMRELAPRVRALGARALSYSWGGGGDRNALGTYSDPLAAKSPWGGALGFTPEDFRAFAKAAGAEAVAFGVPIRSMVPLLKWIPPGARAATVAYGEAMTRALGCGEDFHCYGQMGGEMTWLGGWNAAGDHLALQEALARALAGPGLTWTIYGLDWFPARDPRLVNVPVYELTTKLLGQGFPVAIDLHEYHARPHWTGAASVDLDNPEVRAAVLSTGAKRAGFM
ncbi:MAG: hypothetical protein K8I02_04045, partial [Candidatus Methylomirabilis sp.]|nr:hypothetical protein [Deltaproteobacteria bacterium]